MSIECGNRFMFRLRRYAVRKKLGQETNPGWSQFFGN